MVNHRFGGDAELHFELGEFEGWHSGEIQAQGEQGSLAHKWELKLGKVEKAEP